MPEAREEDKRGGTEEEPIEDQGQKITIHAVKDEGFIYPETPSMVQEFFDQLNESKAPNGCIMLPGNL